MILKQNKLSKKQLMELVLLKIYLALLIVLVLLVPFANYGNNRNLEQFYNPFYATEYRENLKTSDPGHPLSFENTGDEDALNVNVSLSSLNNSITITNDFQDFIVVPQNNTGISLSYYIIKIESSCPADYIINFKITITDDSYIILYFENSLTIVEGGILSAYNSDVASIIALIGGLGLVVLICIYYLVKRQHKQKRLRESKNLAFKILKVKGDAIIGEINKLIAEGEKDMSYGNLSRALQKYNKGFKLIKENKKLFPTMKLKEIESKIKHVKDDLNIKIENKINISIKNGEKFESEYKFGETLKSYKTALENLDNLPKSKERGLLIKNLKSKIDIVYSLKIGELKDAAEELKNLGRPNNAIKSYKMAIKEAENMYYAPQRNKAIEDINICMNQTYLVMLKLNIDKAHKLRSEFKYEEAIKNYNVAMNTALNLTDTKLKSKKVREIRRYVNEIKVAFIKSTILNLGTKFGRLEVREIAEECEKDEELIIKTVKEMIEGNEIYAKYFGSSRAVAFNLQANIDDIDKLMEKYKEWEKEEKDKT